MCERPFVEQMGRDPAPVDQERLGWTVLEIMDSAGVPPFLALIVNAAVTVFFCSQRFGTKGKESLVVGRVRPDLPRKLSCMSRFETKPGHYVQPAHVHISPSTRTAKRAIPWLQLIKRLYSITALELPTNT